MKIKDHVGGNSVFVHYRAGSLWYRTTDTNFEFPVPIEDTGSATFESTHKSINLMRWIRKHMMVIQEGRN